MSFIIELDCSNCGNEWSRGLEARMEVKSGAQGVFLHPDFCSGHPCIGERVHCSCCALTKTVRVKARRPVSASTLGAPV